MFRCCCSGTPTRWPTTSCQRTPSSGRLSGTPPLATLHSTPDASSPKPTSFPSGVKDSCQPTSEGERTLCHLRQVFLAICPKTQGPKTHTQGKFSQNSRIFGRKTQKTGKCWANFSNFPTHEILEAFLSIKTASYRKTSDCFTLVIVLL